MIKKVLSLFLILMTAWAGLCPAQTATKNYYLVDGLFFEGMPPCMGSGNVVAYIEHRDDEGHEATELRLRKGFSLPDDVKMYATPSEEVPGAEALLMSFRGGMGKKWPVGGAIQTLKPQEWIGKPFPAFKVKDTEGREWTNADIAGHPMVLNFWYTGCGPCIREMPELNKWMELFPDVIYLATTFDSAEKIKKIVESRPFRFTQIADDLFLFKTFNVSGMPVTILVDKKGIIRHIEEGTGNAKLRFMQDRLKKLAEE